MIDKGHCTVFQITDIASMSRQRNMNQHRPTTLRVNASKWVLILAQLKREELRNTLQQAVTRS